MARESEARIACVLVFAAWVVALAPVLLGGRTFAAEPHLAGAVPWYDRLASSIADGHIPEWDDASGLGAAVALEVGRPLVYPPAWLVAALPRPWSIDAMLAAHLLLFGLGAAAWARRFGAEPMGAAIAGSAAALSAAATGMLANDGAICAAAWLPWIGWSADRLAAAGRRRAIEGALLLAVLFGALVLAAGGAAGAALAALLVAVAAVLARAPGRAAAWISIAAGAAAAVLLSAPAWLPAAAAGQLGVGQPAGPVFHPAEIPAVGLALWGALTGGGPARRLAGAAALAIVIAVAMPAAGDAMPAAAAAMVAVLAGLGASQAWAALQRAPRLARWSSAAGALLATLAVGPLAVRAWRMPYESRELIERPPALLASVAATGPLRRRVAWPEKPHRDYREEPPDTGARFGHRRMPRPEQPHRDYRDAPPDTGARFGFAYLPGRDRARDPLLARLWRASSGAAERLVDLFDVELLVLPATVPIPAAMPVVGRSPAGDRVLAENQVRRPRAFVAPSWTWHADEDALLRQLFPVAPDQRRSIAQTHVRLRGTGPAPPRAAPGVGPQPAPPCSIASDRPERVELTCRSTSGGYAVLLDRDAPGWTAEVDGEPAAIVTADLLARAVAVGPGQHAVRFAYVTPGLRLGGVLAALAWLNAVVLALVLRRMRGQPRASVVPIEPG